jgi:hypothetical protein
MMNFTKVPATAENFLREVSFPPAHDSPRVPERFEQDVATGAQLLTT